MSYDLYCYKSKLGYPSVEEAENIIEVEEEENDIPNPNLENIIKTLLAIDPQLYRFDNELNTPEGDITIQIQIFSDNIAIGIPYWYTDEQAIEVIEKVEMYLKVIRNVTGYFTYDPQTEEAFDSKEVNFQSVQQYANISKELQKLGFEERRKPWWKFW